ncbi:uncharacterized protein KQ657_000301 [Scheffersomyces spartinae]|uniref:Zn(2)-C6 fungal-type domain-containing protein n=1 Tax=Scheffersomyces spartinae TaxID=45513 RepID=A0A9P7VFG1_9ASCO|nr:uncharacterized protein KQ657_000301 [Scheffersomyces spartinae]KAG7196286.1 hypothetical protein KQ657_000301 [Scheffersomyces spartinae]
MPDGGDGEGENETKTTSRIPMKKRKYSRGGCMECKRRKIKCDEGKPFCFNCTKVRKECTYMAKKFTFEPVEVSIKKDATMSYTMSEDNNKLLLESPKTQSQLPQLQLHYQHQPVSLPVEHGGGGGRPLPPVLPYSNANTPNNQQQMYGQPPVPQPVLQQASISQPVLQQASIPQPALPPHPIPILPPSDNGQFYQAPGSGPRPSYILQNIAPPPPQQQPLQLPMQNISPNYPNQVGPFPPPLMEPGVSQISFSSSIALPIPDVAMDPLFTEALELATDIGDFLHEESFVPSLQTFDSNTTVTSLSVDSIAQNLNSNNSQPNILNDQGPVDATSNVNEANNVNEGDQGLGSNVRMDGNKSSGKKKLKSIRIGNNALREFIHQHQIAFVDYNSEPYGVSTHDALDEDILHNLETFNVEQFAKDVVADYRLKTSVPKYAWHPDLSVPNDSLIDAVAQDNPLFEKHLPYLKILTNTPLSYHLYPFAESIESNEVLKILLTNLKHSPYLLASLLAMSATFQYNQSGAKIHEQLRFKYATLCLILLGDAFSQHIAKDNTTNFEEAVPKIENLVLTVLVLTSIFTAIAYSSKRKFLDHWKVHLRGAKDLLVNYLRLSKTNNIKRVSFGMALALIWFTSIEMIAILTAETAGVLREESQINDIFKLAGDFNGTNTKDIHDALQRLRLLSKTPKEFNTYFGHSNDSFELIADICRERLRIVDNHEILCRKLTQICARMDAARSTPVIPLCDMETFIVPPESPLHPQNKESSTYNISMAAFGEEVTGEGKTIYYSWFDLVEQLHLDYVFFKVLTMRKLMHLPRVHPLVQDMVRLVLKATFFIKRKTDDSYLQDKQSNNILLETARFYLPATLFDMRCIMVQSPLRIAGICSFDDEQLEQVEIFFMGCVKLGNGSSMSALHAISKHREKLKSVKSPLTASDATRSTYLEDDLNEYMEIDGKEAIAFA